MVSQKEDKAGSFRASGHETVHKECVFDEEQGEMVEVGCRDEEWLNGREAMPHQTCLSRGCTSQLPLALTQVVWLAVTVLQSTSSAARIWPSAYQL